MAVLQWTCCLSTTEVTFEGVVSTPVTRVPLSVECLMEFNFSSHLSECSSFPRVPTRSKPISSFVALAKCYHFLHSCGSCHHLGDGVHLGEGQPSWLKNLLVTRQGILSLGWMSAIMRFGG